MSLSIAAKLSFIVSITNDAFLKVSRERPIERCGECGNVVKLNYVGPEEDAHARKSFEIDDNYFGG
jgi:hypothetical protein